MSRYGRFVVCKCGWFDEPSHGSRWFTEKAYPVCPDCGRSTRKAKFVTAQIKGIFRRRLVPSASEAASASPTEDTTT